MEAVPQIGRCSKPRRNRGPIRSPSSTSSRSTSGCAPSCASNSCGSSLLPRGLPNAWSSRSAVAGLLEILAITSRGDARGDVLKELERQMSALKDFQNRPGVDSARLRAVLSALMRRREEEFGWRELPAEAARVGVPERDQAPERHPGRHLRIRPAGFLPWLSRDPDTREADLAAWLATIRPLCQSVSGLFGSPARTRARPRRPRPAEAPDHLRTRPAGAAPAHHAAGSGGALPRSERQPSPLLAALPALAQRPQPPRAGDRRRSFVLATCT